MQEAFPTVYVCRADLCEDILKNRISSQAAERVSDYNLELIASKVQDRLLDHYWGILDDVLEEMKEYI